VQNPFRWPFFSPAVPEGWPRLSVQGAPAADGPPLAKGARHWVLSRGLCRFRLFRQPATVGSSAKSALRLQLIAWSPFDQSSYFVVMQKDVAMVWAWDGPAAEAWLRAAQTPTPAPTANPTAAAATAQLWPEAVCRPRPQGEVCRLVQGIDGWEAQTWSAGVLNASRWWPTQPDVAEFQRWAQTGPAAGPSSQPSLSVVADAAHQAWAKRPWAEGLGLQALQSTASPLERVVVGATLVGLVGLSAAQGRQLWDVSAQRQSTIDARERLQASLGSTLVARERALSLSGEAQELSAAMSAVQPLELLQHLSERLPSQGVLLRELELQGQRLRISLDLPADVPRAQVVKELQAAGWLTQVSEVRDSSERGGVSFEMLLSGNGPPLSIAAAGRGDAPPPGSGAVPPIPNAAAPTLTPAPTPAFPSATAALPVPRPAAPAPANVPANAPIAAPPTPAPQPAAAAATRAPFSAGGLDFPLPPELPTAPRNNPAPPN